MEMLEQFFKFLIVIFAINAALMFIFPEIFASTNEQLITKINTNITVANAYSDKNDFTTDDLNVLAIDTGTSSYVKTSTDSDTTTKTVGYSDFLTSQNNLLQIIMNMFAGYFKLADYIKTPMPLAYFIFAIVSLFQSIGLFYFFAKVVGILVGFFR